MTASELIPNTGIFCLKCGHNLARHVIMTYGRYDYMEIQCQEAANEEEYTDNCGCNAGFKKVQIKKEFTSLNE